MVARVSRGIRRTGSGSTHLELPATITGWVMDGWPTALISMGTMPPVWTRKTGWPSARNEDCQGWKGSRQCRRSDGERGARRTYTDDARVAGNVDERAVVVRKDLVVKLLEPERLLLRRLLEARRILRGR